MSSEVGRRQLEAFVECQRRGDVGRGFSHLSLALCLLPHLKRQYYTTFLTVFEEWSGTVEETKGLQEALTICEAALSVYPHSPDIQFLLAKILYRHGSLPEAWNYASLARASCPRDPNARDTWSRLTNALVDRWHLPMINDRARNFGFKGAIERAITRGHNTVLDIGSGTGLLSLYAKTAGATEVYACEVDKFMCEMGRDILKLNGDTSNVSILNKHSSSIIIPQDIPHRVSLVVSETVDAGLLGEHILTTLQHAWQHLLLPPPPPTTTTTTTTTIQEAATSTTTQETDTLPVLEEVNKVEEKEKKPPEKAHRLQEEARITQEKATGDEEKTSELQKKSKNIPEKATGIQKQGDTKDVQKKGNKGRKKAKKNIPKKIADVQSQPNGIQENASKVEKGRDAKEFSASCESLKSSLNSNAVTGETVSVERKLGQCTKYTHGEDSVSIAVNGTGVDIENDPPLPSYGSVIPSRAEVFVALINCEYVAKQTRLIDGNFSYFKDRNVRVKLDEPYMSEKLCQVPGGYKLLSRWTHVTTINFNSIDDIERHQRGDINGTLDLQCTESGTIDAIVLAFILHLDDTEHINTFPETLHTQWENAVYPVSLPTHLKASDRVAVDVECQGVMRLSVQESCLQSDAPGESNLYLQASALRFLNSKTFTRAYISAAECIATKLGMGSRRNGTTADSKRPLVICDTTPFPVAGLKLLSLRPHSRLYVEEEEVQKALLEVGVEAGLSEDLEEAVDVLFLWPTTGEGTLKDDFVKKILLYRLMLSEEGIVFPQEVDLVVGVVGSSALTAMTRVDDANTCGVRLAEVFNLVQTVHQLDVPLAALQDLTEATAPTPVLRLSLSTGDALPLVQSRPQGREDGEMEKNSLMELGGDVVEMFSDITFTRTTTVSALPYWFVIRASDCFYAPGIHSRSSSDTNGSTSSPTVPCSMSQPLAPINSSASSPSDSQSSEAYLSLSTRELDSPCNQCVLLLKEPLGVVEGDVGKLEVVWREGVFNGTITSTNCVPLSAPQ